MLRFRLPWYIVTEDVEPKKTIPEPVGPDLDTYNSVTKQSVAMVKAGQSRVPLAEFKTKSRWNLKSQRASYLTGIVVVGIIIGLGEAIIASNPSENRPAQSLSDNATPEAAPQTSNPARLPEGGNAKATPPPNPETPPHPNHQPKLPKWATLFLGETFAKGVPFIATVWLTYLTATLFSQRRASRDIAFKLIEELNSVEFEHTRRDVSDMIAHPSPIREKDSDQLAGYFPLFWLKPDYVTPTHERFSEEHALTRVVYFVYRIQLYVENEMVEPRLIRDLFHDFFSHFEIFLLEFAAGYRMQRASLRLNKETIFDERWESLPDGIEQFFKKTLELSGKLPADHEYMYFPNAMGCAKKQQDAHRKKPVATPPAT